MVDRLFALSGPHAWLAWVSLISAGIGLLTVIVQAATKAPVQVGPSLAFRTAFIIVYSRIAYRTVNPDGPLTYWAILIYAAPGLACLYAMIDALRYQGEPDKDIVIAAQVNELIRNRHEIAHLKRRLGIGLSTPVEPGDMPS